MIEIERRFLARVAGPAALRDAQASEIRQGYLSLDEPAVRIRRRGPGWVLTVKAGRGLVRREVEVEVSAEAGEALMEIAGAHVLEKTRHVLGRWEVDVFTGKLEGLVVAEAELRDADEPLPPAPAGIRLLREITDDGAWTNQRLAALDEVAARALVEAAYAP